MQEMAAKNEPLVKPNGDINHESASMSGVQGARNKLDAGIRELEQKIAAQIQPYQSVVVPDMNQPARTLPDGTTARPNLNLYNRVIQEISDSKLPADVKKREIAQTKQVLKREGITPDTQITMGNGDALLHKVNARNRSAMANDKSTINDLRQANPQFFTNEAIGNVLRDSLYGYSEELGIQNIASTRRLIGDAIATRNLFQNMIHQGDTRLPVSTMRQMTAGAVGALTGGAAGTLLEPILGPMTPTAAAMTGGSVGAMIAKGPTINSVVDSALAKRTTRPVAPSPFAGPRRLNAPAADMVGTSGPSPTVTPDVMEEAYGKSPALQQWEQPRALIAQSSEQVPVVGSYNTIKLADPSLPDFVYDGKYPVQFPDGDIRKFATAKQATQAQRVIDKWQQANKSMIVTPQTIEAAQKGSEPISTAWFHPTTIIRGLLTEKGETPIELPGRGASEVRAELSPQGNWLGMSSKQIVTEQPKGVVGVRPSQPADQTRGIQVVHTDPLTGEKHTVIFDNAELASAFKKLMRVEAGEPWSKKD